MNAPRIAWLVLLLGLCVAPVRAQENLDPALRATLEDAARLLDAGSAGHAIGDLEALLPRLGDQPQARAVTQHLLGLARLAAGDRAGAERALRFALAAPELPAAPRHEAELRLAGILIASGRDGEGLEHLERWLNGEAAPPPEVRRLAALAYARSGRCDRALPQLQAVSRGGGALEPAWMQALGACQQRLEHRGATTDLVLDLLRTHPQDKSAWLRGVALYRDAGDTPAALALLELLQRRGQLNGEEILELARAYLAAGLPVRAARLLEDGIAAGAPPRSRATLELAGDAWRLARDYPRAIARYRDALALRADGRLLFAVGELAFELERWDECVDALGAALAQPVLKQVAQAHLLRGIAAVERAQWALARRSLEQARKAPETRPLAEWWLAELAARPANPAAPG